MPADKQLPNSARIVIIGGGVAGASIAYHLAELGERDVVLLDRHELTSGSTFHSAGLVGQLRSDPTLTAMNMYSVELYRKLQASEYPPSWVECGGIRLASSQERLEEIRQQIGWAQTSGLPLQEISVSEAQRRFPLMDPDGVLGAAYLPGDGYIDPSQLCYGLAALARKQGVRAFSHTRVLGISTARGRVRAVQTDRGDVECEAVVNCGGMFAAEIGRMLGVRVPVVPMSHQYLVTDSLLDSVDQVLPTLRDPDLLVYYRQELQGLVMGGYERRAKAWKTSSYELDAIPSDFNAKLLAEDWERFTEITENSQVRVPHMADVGIRKLINGPEAFTPDNEFCLGETDVGGFFVAAGLCAHGIAGAGGIGKVMAEWITTGEPGLDVSHMDINRFGSHYRSPAYTLARITENYETYYDIRYPDHERTAGRPLRISPAYSWHREHGACFGEKAGWERVNYYNSNALEGGEALRPRGWPGKHWSPAVGVEHNGTRHVAGLFDESSFAKISVSGSEAPVFLNWVCDNNVARKVGSVTYTQALNSRGGIECDFTVTRTDEEEFLIVTGTAFGTHDMSWLRKQARRTDAQVRIADITGLYACYALWGPRARQILGAVTDADLWDFRFMTAREIAVGNIPVRALRVTFVGELGWELYTPTEYGAALWHALLDAGSPHGMVVAGYRAIDSMRVEKGYRAWGADITPDTTPYEAGLGFCVKLDKPGGFLGREALVDAGDPKRQLMCMTLDDPHSVVLGNEPVRIGGEVVGRVTSGGYGYSVGSSIAYGYVPTEEALTGTAVEISIFGQWISGRIAQEPLLDPKFERVRG